MHDAMAYCGPRGIPYLHFMGGPAEWDPLSRQLALAWSSHDRARCCGCGTHPADWDDKRGGDRKAAYIAARSRCRGDEVLAAGRAELPKDEVGWRLHLVPNPDSPRWNRDD